jgi:hypothetical protein
MSIVPCLTSGSVGENQIYISMLNVDVVMAEVISLDADLSYPKHPIKILNQKDRATRRKTIKFFKI